MDRSSTFFSLLAVISILAIASIAINDVAETPLRKPFPNSAAQTADKSVENIPAGFEKVLSEEMRAQGITVQGESSDITPEIKVTVPENSESQKEIVFDLQKKLGIAADLENLQKETLEFESASSLKKNAEREAQQAPKNTTILVSEKVPMNAERFALERLIAVGLKNPVIQKKPYTGVLFDEFEIESLSSFNLNYQLMFEDESGAQKRVMELYAMTALDADLANEVYDLLKYKSEGSLGVTINETNQHGMNSFFINFLPAAPDVFLVVKYPDSVYALRYPRSLNMTSGLEYHEIYKKLL